MQEHRATRLHWDFRLEANGVMPSWAVTKGPTLVAGDKRLAMKTEDHPMDYRTFEGVIPEGNYGAGEVIVWDDGTYALFEGHDPAAEIAHGKLKVVLNGKKLRGLFTLVRMKPREGEHGEPWLLFKDRDEYADAQWKIEDHAESVKTGMTLAQLQQRRKDAPIWKSNRATSADGTAVKRAARARAARADPIPRDATPMLATLVDEPFDDERWLFELKWDGYRGIAVVERDAVTLTSRNGRDLLHQFPEMAALNGAFRSIPVVVDGELCVLDAEGKPDFQALQSRDKPAPGRRRPKPSPVTFVVFDLLYADGRDVRDRPLEERKRLLEDLIVPERSVMFSKHWPTRGIELYELAQRRGLEGIVGKVRSSPYRSTRSREWVKIKAKQRQEFVVGGWTEPRGSRKEFGSLLVGYYDGTALRYAGHVGSGYDARLLRDVSAKLRARERATCPFVERPKTNTPAHWVKPELVAEIAFAEWTREGILRQPVFMGLRSDKDAKTVVRERAHHADPDA
ncbi:MAG: non-homologous end-joining DNA ligase [Candidatus Eremiobacteraeota bacterium]|nr:non-homologous end-joining DNA ligase [Candidatus Eremiobacteraeota bacterium]